MSNGLCLSCGATLGADVLDGVCPKCTARCLLLDEESDLIESLPRRFGDYDLLERIAHGGMGVVYRARQSSLGRIVAVKMLLAGEFATREFVQRFRAEAAAGAILQHPNIVPIHEVGVHEGLHYFSMGFVHGRSLSDLVGTTPLPAARAARYVRLIAGAVHYAHERGVLHRDLKPSNVLVDSGDQPHVTDFGLAKRLPDTAAGSASMASPVAGVTLPGQILGSPGFMPPEQAGATGVRIGPTSDVYSLGAVLYHALTARPPFQSETLPQVLQQILETDPIPPRRLNPAIPVDLETICLKCLAKEPSTRYRSAEALAAELDRFLAGEPIHARPLGLAGRAWRWCRRQPALATLTAALFFVLLAGLFGILRELRRAERAEQATTTQLGRAYLEQARANRRSGRNGQQFETLAAIRQAISLPDPPDTAQLRHEAIAALALPDIRWRGLGTLRPSYVAIDTLFERYSWADRQGTIHLCRVADDSEIFTLDLPANRTNCLSWPCFSPDGRQLVVPYADGWIRIWDLERRQIRLQIKAESQNLILAFSPPGERLIVGGPDNRIRLLDLLSGGWERELALPFRPWWFQASPDGRQIAVITLAGSGSTVRLVDLGTGRARDLPHANRILAVAWHPTGDILAAAGEDRAIHLWQVGDLETRRLSTEHQSTIIGVAFHPAGELLASTSWDGTTQLWNVRTGRRMATMPQMIETPQFSRQQGILGGRTDGWRRVARFDIADLPVCRSFEEPPLMEANLRRAWTINWSPDERMLSAGTSDGVRLWDVASGRILGLLPLALAHSTWFEPGGTAITAVGINSVQRWSLTPGADADERLVGPRRTVAENPKFQWGSISSNATTFAYTHNEWVTVWTNGQRAFHLPHTRPLRVAVSPDGKWIGSIEQDEPVLRLWDAVSGRLIWTRRRPLLLKGHIEFTADSSLFVSSAADEFTFWDVATGTPRRQIPRRDSGDFPGPLAFSRDGRMMALAVSRTLVELRDGVTGDELGQLESPQPSMLIALGFSPSGGQLAALGETHSLQVWDLRLLRRELSGLGLDWRQPPIAAASAALQVPLRWRAEPAPFDIPSRPPGLSPAQVDLGAFYTGSLTQMWPDVRDNNLAQLDAGRHEFAGIPYDIRGVIALRHPTLPSLPKVVRDIPIRRQCRTLHFLHGVGFSAPHGTRVATYVVQYADGQAIEVPILYGYETSNWRIRPDQRPRRPEIAWSGPASEPTGRGSLCALFHFGWDNPRPDVEIVSVDFVSKTDQCSPFLAALTAEEDP